MNIKFKGHSPTEREVEITQKELFQLFEIMKNEFVEHITFARFDSSFPSEVERSIIDFCNNYGVDAEYDKDRIAFFTAVMNGLRNPYQ